MWHKACLMTLLILSPVTWAKNIEPMSFSHEDWEVVCSNTGTCQMAGYGDGQHHSASILFKRVAGQDSAVTTLWVLENIDERFNDVLGDSKTIDFYVQGKNMGQVHVTDTRVGFGGELNTVQAHAVLAAAKRQGLFEFKKGNTTWSVSSKGMAAVLLKTDEFQQRVGTVGALLQKGSQDESHVLQPQAKLKIKRVVTDAEPYLILKPSDKAYAKLKAKLVGDFGAINHDEEEGDEQQSLKLYRLNAQQTAVTTLCWTAAYNEGHCVWVMDSSLQGKAKLVTNEASSLSAGVIFAWQKGRGIGDCWSIDLWVWDGQQFVKSKDMSTGQCAGIAMGGAWQLDLIETDIIKE